MTGEGDGWCPQCTVHTSTQGIISCRVYKWDLMKNGRGRPGQKGGNCLGCHLGVGCMRLFCFVLCFNYGQL